MIKNYCPVTNNSNTTVNNCTRTFSKLQQVALHAEAGRKIVLILTRGQ